MNKSPEHSRNAAALDEVARHAQELIDASAAADADCAPMITLGEAGVIVLKHVEAIVERAVHGQIDPLRQLVTEAEELITVQYDHLARIKAEVQMLVVNGERAGVVARAVQAGLKEMRARHADLVDAKTVSTTTVQQ